MTRYAAPTSPKSDNTYVNSKGDTVSPLRKPKGEGSRVEAAPPEWATGPGYWYNDGYEVRWIPEKGFNDAGQTHFGHGGDFHPYENHPNQWIGPKFDEDEIEEETPEEIPIIYHEGENIVIEKRLYGNRSFSRLANRDFNELHQEKKIDIKKFFGEYDELFYEIPKQGAENSHNFLIEKSTDYIRDYIDPKDEIIENLENQVQGMEEELETLRNPEEHPFYRNGTVISRGGGGMFFYMDKGKKRKIVGGRPSDVWAALKTSLGYKETQDDFEDNIVITVPDAICDEIPGGPSLGIEDLGSGNIFEAETAWQNSVRLGGSHDWRIDPTLYNSTEEYQNNLENQIEEAWDTERDLEQRYHSYVEDIEYEETEAKRAEAEALSGKMKIELDKVRNSLVLMKKIYDALESNEDITIEGLDEIYEEFSDKTKITESMRSEFAGWEKGRFDDRGGKYGAFRHESSTRTL